MKKRCANERCNSYHRYGGRGITVCEEWQNSFERFLSDVGEKPFPGAELDREDNDGDYRPGNVRWVTKSVNDNNRSSNSIIVHNGRSLTKAQWAREIGCTWMCLHRYLKLHPVHIAMDKASSRVKSRT
jgi:hypothetical protein